ncbi:MAG: hypothetical protein U5N55_04545 [Cypionkella sp.]|nr:hypothetical protein [Cypionkella sp.]
MPKAMMAAMQAAGFVGIETAGGVIYARTHDALPEFTAQPVGEAWRFAIQWPLRVSAAQLARWNALHPTAPMDLELGETRLQFTGGPEALADWRGLVDDMVATCTRWRRATRQMDEGM